MSDKKNRDATRNSIENVKSNIKQKISKIYEQGVEVSLDILYIQDT